MSNGIYKVPQAVNEPVLNYAPGSAERKALKAELARAAQAAEAVNREMVGRTVADVERDLILQTLDHCLGNRTHAANILGISIRTLRNKLKQYTDEGVRVPMPGGESRVA